jgi:hypothetical protein
MWVIYAGTLITETHEALTPVRSDPEKGKKHVRQAPWHGVVFLLHGGFQILK